MEIPTEETFLHLLLFLLHLASKKATCHVVVCSIAVASVPSGLTHWILTRHIFETGCLPISFPIHLARLFTQPRAPPGCGIGSWSALVLLNVMCVVSYGSLITISFSLSTACSSTWKSIWTSPFFNFPITSNLTTSPFYLQQSELNS